MLFNPLFRVRNSALLNLNVDEKKRRIKKRERNDAHSFTSLLSSTETNRMRGVLELHFPWYTRSVFQQQCKNEKSTITMSKNNIVFFSVECFSI